MMNPIHAKLKIYSYSLFTLTGAAVLLRFLALILNYETDVGYFSLSSPLPAMANALLCLSILWAFSMLIFIPRDLLTADLPAFSTPSVFASVLCGLFFLFFAAAAFLNVTRGGVSFSGEFYLRDRIVYYTVCAASLFSGIYFFTALKTSLLRETWRILLGFCPPLWALLTLAQCYFDLTQAMNNPIKTMILLALIGAMLYFLQELRVLLDRAQPRIGLIFSFSALLLVGAGAVSGLLALPRLPYALGDYTNTMLSLAAVWLYILFRTIDTVSHNLSPKAPQAEDKSNEDEEQI